MSSSSNIWILYSIWSKEKSFTYVATYDHLMNNLWTKVFSNSKLSKTFVKKIVIHLK